MNSRYHSWFREPLFLDAKYGGHVRYLYADLCGHVLTIAVPRKSFINEKQSADVKINCAITWNR